MINESINESFKERMLKFFQVFGKSLMIPISILAAIGIVMGLTAALNNQHVVRFLPFMNNQHIAYILLTIRAVALRLFPIIPVLFSICIAFGLAKKEKHIAAMAGFIGYYIMLFSASLMVASDYINLLPAATETVFGHQTVRMGAFGGMLSGVIVSVIHNKFYNLELPSGLSFFGGKRSVAIITFLFMMVFGQILPFVWLPIGTAIDSLGRGIAGLGLFGTFIYGFLEKLLLPLGLQHILINLFRTTSIGGVTYIASMGYVEGNFAIVSALFNQGAPAYQILPFMSFMSQGRAPIHLFGLPAAAFAMYKVTDFKRKPFIKPLLISGVVSVMLVGITEPIEFLFLFTAPKLFLFHAIMTGVGFVLMDIGNVMMANISAGLIDLVVFGILVENSRWWMVFVLGAPFVLIYYYAFSWYFKKYNLEVAPGIEMGEVADFFGDAPTEEQENLKVKLMNTRAEKIITALGGINNIQNVYNCVTRLRVDVNDSSIIDEASLKSTKALGVKIISKSHVQVIYGAIVEKISEEVRDALNME